MKRLCLIVLSLSLAAAGKAQCPNPQFSVLKEENLCRNSPVHLINENTDAANYYWDFCPETFSELPASKSLNVTGSGQGFGYALVQEGGNWYGFLLSRSLDKLIRLDFGADLENMPVVNDLGNPGGLMDAPEGIRLYKDGTDWFAFVGKGENSTGQVVKLSFGPDLTSVPSSTGYGTFGLGSIRIRDLAITKQDNNIFLTLLVYNTASLNRVSFGSSLHNNPGTNNLVAIPGASLPRGFDIVMDCNGIRAHVVSENGSVQQISFGNDIAGPITVEGSFTFSSVIQPWKIRTIFSGGNYFSFISNNNRKYSVINFGDLSLVGAPKEVSNNNDLRIIGIDVVKFRGETFVHGGTGGTSVLSAAYQNTCGVVNDYSYADNPESFVYGREGTATIDLSVFKDQNASFSSSRTINIKDLDAPQIKISSEGICQGSDVTFTASDNQVLLSWEWDFGNGMTSNSASATTSYSDPGRYAVFLGAQATNTCHTGDHLELQIYPPPTAEFTMPPGLLCTNNAFKFSTTTPDVYDANLSYDWFVDGQAVGIDRDLEYIFQSTGTKAIKLKTSIPGCFSEATNTTSNVEAGPRIAFLVSGVCEDEAFGFQSEFSDPIDSFIWNFGDGETSADAEPQHLFSDAGDYIVSLSATNAIGCETTERKTVSVHSRPLVNFDRQGPPNACADKLTLFQNTTTNPDTRPITQWLWQFNDSNNSQTHDGINGEHLFSKAGTYPVSLTATTAAGCTAILEKEIIIHPSPSTAFTFTPACEDVRVIFTGPPDALIKSSYWEIGTSYSHEASPTHTFAAPGDYPLYAEFYGSNGCISTIERNIHVPVPLSPDFSVLKNCVDHEAIFTDITNGIDPVATRFWDFGDGITATASPVNRLFHEQRTVPVTLQVTTQSGCSYTTTKQVEILPAPVAEFSASPETGAYPLDVMFTNTSIAADHFEWDFGDGTGNTSVVESPAYTYSTSGTFDITLKAYNTKACEDAFTKSISIVSPLPDADIEMIQLVEQPDGSTKLIVTIHNKGNTVLKNLPVTFDFAGDLSLSQTVAEPIVPGAQLNFILNSAILNAENLTYLCVALDVENDLSPDGNRSCSTLDSDLFVFPAYPNPATDGLKLEWLSQDSETVTVSLTDRIGRTIFRERVSNTRGLNSHTIDLYTLPVGLYLLLVDDGSSKRLQRIAVER